MMELVRLAEYAESKAKEDIAALLNKRSAMLEALTAMSAYRHMLVLMPITLSSAACCMLSYSRLMCWRLWQGACKSLPCALHTEGARYHARLEISQTFGFSGGALEPHRSKHSFGAEVHMSRRNDDESSEHNEEFAHLELRTADARERQEAATKQYNRLCSICIAAQQARATGP